MRKHSIWVLLISCGLLWLISCQKAPVHSSDYDTIALTNGVLIDGTGADPVSGAVVVIRDGLIEQVGQSPNVQIPDDAIMFDLHGAAILPGLFNAHVHNGFNASNLKAWAAQGVTTVRDLGANPLRLLSTIRSELAADTHNARLVYAGPMVTIPNGYPIVPWGPSYALPLESVEDARQKIGDLLDSGADLVKIALERGDIFQQSIPVLSEPMAAVICSVAHARGTVVSAHILVARDIELAIKAGVDDIAHMSATYVSNALIDSVVDSNIFWVPTLELWHGSGPSHLSQAIDNLSRFVAAGGQVALGTDYDGYTTPFDLGMPIREIGWMLQAGMTPMQVIVAATHNAAIVCNMQDELGTIETGKIADILVVGGNPLENLEESMTDLRLVIHNGVVIVNLGITAN